MCLTCGCGMPYNDMGDPKNITVKDIKEAVETEAAGGITEEQAVENLVQTWKKVKPEDKDFKSESA
jgi:hypothetical protein